MSPEVAEELRGTSLVIGDDLYPLDRDQSGQPIYANTDPVSLGRSDVVPQVPVSDTWDLLIGGMGEMRRISPGSRGYAFSDQMEWTTGRGRLSPTKESINPTKPAIDARTFGFEGRPNGQAVFKTGEFLSGAATDAHGFGAQSPMKGMITFLANADVGEDGAPASSFDECIGIGFSDGVNNMSCFVAAEDGTTTRVFRSHSQTNCFEVNEPSANSNPKYVEGKVTSFDGTNINMTWDEPGAAAKRFNWWGIGGPDVKVKVGEFEVATNGVNNIITNVGFKPDLMFFAYTAQVQDIQETPDTHGIISIGIVDSGLNQGATAMSMKSSVTTTVNNCRVTTERCLIELDENGAHQNNYKVSSMFGGATGGGFIFAADTIPSTPHRVLYMAIKGVQSSVAQVAKPTTAIDQPASDPGFTSESFLTLMTNALSNNLTTNDAVLAMSATAAAASGATSCWLFNDVDGTPQTALERLSDSDSGLQMLTTKGGIIDNVSVVDEIDTGVAGWLRWTTVDGNSSLMLRVALAANDISDQSFIHHVNGENVTRFYVDDNGAIIEDFVWNFPAGKAGRPALFGTTPDNAQWYVPMGEEVFLQRLQVIADVGVATAGDFLTVTTSNGAVANYSARAMAVTNKGASAALVRGGLGDGTTFNQHKVDQSTQPPGSENFGADTDVGGGDSPITDLVDSGNILFCAKADNLYEFRVAGIARQISRFNQDSKPDGSSTLEVPSGGNVTYYNHDRLYFWTGGDLFPVSHDELPTGVLQDIDGISHVPIRGRHLSTLVVSDNMIYSSYAVTEGGTTVTHILAGRREKGQTRLKWDTYKTCDAVARLFYFDAANRLWYNCLDGTVNYIQLGTDGDPYAARDNRGYGETDTQHQTVFSESDFGFPLDKKQINLVEIYYRNHPGNDTIPIQLALKFDGGSFTPIGTIITGDPADRPIGRRFINGRSEATAGVYIQPIILIDNNVGGTYTPAPDLTPFEIWWIRVSGWVRPRKARRIKFTVDPTREVGEGVNPLKDPPEMLSDLQAMEGGIVQLFTDPDTIAGSIYVTSVVQRQAGSDPVKFLIDVEAVIWPTS
jgi:hypothetical protein